MKIGEGLKKKYKAYVRNYYLEVNFSKQVVELE